MVIVALVLVVIAIGDDGDDGTQLSVNGGEVDRAGTLVLGQFRSPTGRIANPYVTAGDSLVSDGVWQLVFEPLFYFNHQTGESEPWLAMATSTATTTRPSPSGCATT